MNDGSMRHLIAETCRTANTSLFGDGPSDDWYQLADAVIEVLGLVDSPPDADKERREQNLISAYKACPPIIRAAIDALLLFQRQTDEMGYDLSYYQEDLPKTVAKAIEPWRLCMWCDKFLSQDVHQLCGSHLLKDQMDKDVSF